MITKLSNLAEYTTVSPSSFVPIVDVNENTNSKNKKISIADLRKYFYTNQNLSRSFSNHTPGFYYFGDNSDGPGNFSGSITALRTRITSSFSSSLDGPPVIKNFSSLFVSRSVVISPPTRCRGMLIFVDGDATISGSIRMTARGAKFTGSDASFQVVNPPYLGDYWSALQFPSSSYLSRVFAVGASGGTPTAAGGTVGSAGTGGRSGGGGGGGSSPVLGGTGTAGTSFSGGSGGGGAGPVAGAAGYAFGGKGGSPTANGTGAGAGNPAGTASAPGAGAAESGTGGLLILIVRGNLKIGPNGSIITNGSNGGNAPSTGAGGGSGGGVLYVYYGGTLTNNGTLTANGGSGGTGGPSGGNGGAGGAGTVVLSRLNVAFPVAN